MFKKIIATLFVYSSTCHPGPGTLPTSDDSRPVRYLQYFNQGALDEMIRPSPQSCSITPIRGLIENIDSPERPFHACIAEICGSTTANMSAQEIYHRVTNTTDNITREWQDILDLVSEYYGHKIDHELALFRHSKRLIDTGVPLEIPKELRLPIATSVAMAHYLVFLKHFASIPKEDRGSFKFQWDVRDLSANLHFDRDIARGQIAEYVNPALRDQLVEAVNELVQLDDFQTLLVALYTEAGFPTVISTKYPGPNLQSIIEREKSHALKLDGEIKQAYSSTAIELIFGADELITPDIFQQVSATNNLSDELLQEFFGEVISVRFAHRILVRPRGIEKLQALVQNSYNEIFNLSEVSKQLDAIIANIEGLKGNREHIVADIASCQAVVSNNLAGLPSKGEKDAFLQKALAIKNTLKNHFASRLSPQTLTGLASFLDNIHLELPADRDEMKYLIELNLRRNLSVMQEEQRKYASSDENTKNQWALANQLAFITDWSVEEFSNDAQTICQDYQLKDEQSDEKFGLTDHLFNAGTRKIQVSWVSMQNPAIAEGILGHELAHAASAYLRGRYLSSQSYQKYKAARMCLNDLQTTMGHNRVEALHYIDAGETTVSDQVAISQYTEEDWADLISATALPKALPNYVCFWMSQHSNQYTNSEVFRAAEAEEEDTRHAPSLFRLLHIEFAKQGELPGPCLSALENNDIALNLNKCEL